MWEIKHRWILKWIHSLACIYPKNDFSNVWNQGLLFKNKSTVVIWTKHSCEQTAPCDQHSEDNALLYVCKSLLLQDCLQLSIQLWLSTFSSMLWGCFQAGNTEVRGQEYSPCPPSRNSVMIAALQGDQGLVRLIWISVGDIMWFSCIFPNRFSQDLTLSCGMLNTCPVEREWDLRCLSWVHRLWLCIYTFRDTEILMWTEWRMTSTEHTELMSSGESWRKAVVFDYRAAPLGVAHGANICHAKCVTGGGAAEVLDEKRH